MANLVLRPQPVGVFGLPASYLVLPPVTGGEAEEAVKKLIAGQIPASFPAEWQFFRLTLEGETDLAYAALLPLDSPEAEYNRFVLESSPAEYDRLSTILEGELAVLLEVVGYTLGYTERPPEAGELQGELAALVRMAQATYCLEHGQPDQALKLLEIASEAARPVSPVFAAQLEATLAGTKHETQGADYSVIQMYRQAIERLEKTDLATVRGEMWLNLGTVYQEMAGGKRAALLEAVHCYQEALRVLTREKHPQFYALAQSNLGLAYLSMPLKEASDQLRAAIAVQALREALKIYTPDNQPEMWASTQLNLANALVYLPSSHPQENLIQAVELYEELLTVRKAEDNPAGYARLLANQGNALAHLGIFDHATAKLTEAQIIFENIGEGEAVASVAEVLAEIKAAQLEKTEKAEVGAS
jgi:tetratricopeptide (TPR) repeat protein